MKKLLALAAFACLLFASCNDDDNDSTPKNYLSIDGVKSEMPYAYLTSYDDGYYGIEFSGSEIQKIADVKVIVEFLFNFDTDNDGKGTITEGTYIYMRDMDSSYDPTKHYFDVTYVTRDTDGQMLTRNASEFTNSTITIKKSGGSYIFDYSFEIDGKVYIGFYEGEIKRINSSDIW